MEGMVCGFCRFREQPSPKQFRNERALERCCPEYVGGEHRQGLLSRPCEKFKMRSKGSESRMWQMTQTFIQRRRHR